MADEIDERNQEEEKILEKERELTKKRMEGKLQKLNQISQK